MAKNGEVLLLSRRGNVKGLCEGNLSCSRIPIVEIDLNTSSCQHFCFHFEQNKAVLKLIASFYHHQCPMCEITHHSFFKNEVMVNLPNERKYKNKKHVFSRKLTLYIVICLNDCHRPFLLSKLHEQKIRNIQPMESQEL